MFRHAGAAGLGLAGAALIGCGADDDEAVPGGAPTTATGAQGTAGTPQPTPAEDEPQVGGTLRIAVQADVDTFDVLAAANGKTASYFAGYIYPRLFKFVPGDGGPATGALEGDVFESWEQPDELTFVFHIRQGMIWDQRAPTNGRQVNAEDVVASWEYFKEKSFYKNDIVNDANPQAAVKSMEATDDATVTMRLAHPDAAVLTIAAYSITIYVMPAEAFNGGFDLATEWRGAGPFLLTEHRPSVGFTFDRNPDYYGAPRPYVDRVIQTIIPDLAQLEAQFGAKNLHYGIPQVSVVEMHKRLPGTRIDVLEPSTRGANIGMSLRPGSPFLDVRVRRAMNMLIERNTIIDVISEPEAVEAELGVQMGRYWSNPVNAGYGPFWLDPNGPDFGPAAQYLQFNPDEAKKLLDAAGFPYEQEFPLTYTTNAYGRDWPRLAEMLQSMLQIGGMKIVLNGVDYATGWIPNYLRSKGDFEGIGMWTGGGRPDVGQFLQVFWASVGANNQVGTTYPELDELLFAQQTITDFDERVAAVHDVQRYMVENAITVPFIADAGTETIDLSWEGVRNRQLRVWPGGAPASERTPLYWLDESLRA